MLCGVTSLVKSQEPSVEKSTLGIQVGFLGAWIHHEAKLTSSLALRSEFGLDAGISGGSLRPRTDFVFTPVITLEPRWYYNFSKREEKSKNTAGNSGNFLSLKVSAHPDWFTIASDDNLYVVPDLTVVPTWGIRRSIGDHFTFEGGVGLGFRFISEKNASRYNDDDVLAGNLHLRVGYRF